MDLVETAKGVVKESLGDDVTGMAAELSYRFFLAVFPFAIMMAALSGFIADGLNIENPAQRIVNQAADRLPEDSAAVLERQIESVISSRNVSLISFGLIGTIWASAGGVSSLIKALNRAYDVPETRSWWKKTLLAVLLTVSAGLSVVLAFMGVVTISVWGKDIADWMGAATVYDWLLAVARWAVPVVLVMLAVAILYWAAPNVDQKFRFVSPGAVLFTVVWVVATWLFSFYVSNFGAYNATYGALGGVVVLLLWFYLTSIMLLVGAEVNALVDAQVDPDAVRDRRKKVLSERQKDGPTATEELERRGRHGEQPPPSEAGAEQPIHGHGAGRKPATEGHRGMFSTPVMATVGLFAAMFAIRKLVR